MTADVQRWSKVPRTHPPRKLRNFLLEPRFQLKYTAMVVGVTVAVAGVLGFYAYTYSRGQTEMFTIKQIESEVGRGGAPDQAFIEDLQRYAREADRAVALAILGGIGVLALALGVTGIIVTHRMVGPAYKLKMLLRNVGDGRLRIAGGLRKNDELHDVFEAFQGMVESLRTGRERELSELDTAIEAARKAGTSSEVLTQLDALREGLKKGLD